MADPGVRIFEIELLVEGGPVSVAHVRTQIRGAMVATLTGLATTGSNVFDSRPEGRDWNENDLPGLNILTPTDSIDTDRTNSRGKEARQIAAIVECRAKGANSASVADQASAEVQAALAADETLGGLAKDLFLSEAATSLSGEIDRPVAVVRLEVSVGYRIVPTDPETPIE